MLKCEGYKMFRGKMLITPTTGIRHPFEIEGTWLYKPDYDCWYCGGDSFPAEICSVIEDKTVNG